MTTYNGYIKDLPAETKRENEISAIKSILQDYPTNQYWMFRLDALLNSEPADDDDDKSETCACYEHVGDNRLCPDHWHMFFYHDSEFTKADEQERNDLYTMGMGG